MRIAPKITLPPASLLLAGAAPFAVALAASQGHAQSEVADQQRRLVEARAQSDAAAARAAQLDKAAAGERDAAARAAAQEQAQAAKVQKAQADIAAATARIALVDRLLARQQSSLAEQQGPIARLIAALATLAMRPTAVGVVQPGSLDDLVHVRAVLGSTLPLVQARTADLRAAFARSRKLRADQALAVAAMGRSRADLETQRVALAQLEAQHRSRSQDLGRTALAESDKAIGLGERARDLADQMRVTTDAAVTGRSLAALSGPLPRPAQAGDGGTTPLPWTATSAPYRLPVTGRLVTGFGEVSDTGVRSRGLTFAVTPGADVVAPAAGQVVFAGSFRGYRDVVIVDHGDGWTSLVSGMGAIRVRVGDRIRQGAAIGTAPEGTAPEITVELRRRGRAVDLAPLTG